MDLGGKYRVVAEIGHGGTANVYLAVAHGPSGFNKLVVLKVLRREFRFQREFSEMFLNEARLAARLNHQNVVQTLEIFEAENLPVIVMEYLEGKTLAQVIDRLGQGALRYTTHLRILADALAGLHYAHELTDFDGTPLNVVHRDMSPHNLLITYGGLTKVLDFGIAKLQDSQVHTASGVIKGKLRYMPPEQLTGGPLDRRADIFAVGVMLWEAVTCRKMWANASDVAVMRALAKGEIPTAESFLPDLDLQMSSILKRALAADPTDRFATALEFERALDNYLALRAQQVRPREVGEELVRHFAREREQTARTIESKLSVVSSLSADELAEFRPADLSLGGTATGLSASRLNRFRPEPEPRPSLYMAFGIFLLALTGGFAWRQHSGPTELPWQSVTASPQNRVVPPIEPNQRQDAISLRVTVFPEAAELRLNDAKLNGNPAILRLPFGRSEPLTLVASAPGYRTQTQTIFPDRDTELILTLSPSPVAPDAPVTTPNHASTRATNDARAGTPEAGSCDPPYVIDSRGVKRFRPQCLR